MKLLISCECASLSHGPHYYPEHCLLSTILLSIIMCSEEMSIAFQCVDNICPLGIQSLFLLIKKPCCNIQHCKKNRMSFLESPSNIIPGDFKVNGCDSSTVRILTMWDRHKHKKDALCTCYMKVNVKAYKI